VDAAVEKTDAVNARKGVSGDTKEIGAPENRIN
jgi:hypothetical protein